MLKKKTKAKSIIQNDLETSFPITIQEEKVIERLTLSNLFRQLLDSFNVEKGYLFTIKMLILDPGNAIKGYFTTDRFRYGNPIKFLVFTAAVCSFLVLKTNLDTFSDGFKVGMAQGEKNTDALKYALNIQNFINDYFNIVMLIGLPFLSLSLFWFFKKYRYNFTEHLVINSYLLGILYIFFIVLFPLFYFYSESIQLYIYISILSIAFQIYFYIRVFQLKIFSGALLSLLAISLGYILYMGFLFAIIIGYAFIYLKP